ncbi:cytochrome P450 [Rhizoctonia solani]|nr:cytochrome P450 [Rhizoctonia solani]
MWDVILAISVFLCYVAIKQRGKTPRLPPGPPGQFLFGNALEIRKAPFLWAKLNEYAQTYGGIYTFHLLGRPTVVLNTPNAGLDLLEKRATNFATRPPIYMAELSGWAEAILFVPYGPRLRSYRKLLHQTLNPRATLDFQTLQIQEVRKLMKRLLISPEDFLDHAKLYAGAVSIRIAYGHTARDFSDEFIQAAEAFMGVLSEAILPGKWLVETIPLMRHIPSWFPAATFKRKAEEWARMTVKYRQAPFDYVVRNMMNGTAEPSFTSKLLEPEDGAQVSDSDKEMIKIVASHLYGAGADTTSSIIQSFFLAMTLYPDVQSAAQAELDLYLTTKRTLTVADREHLPYTHAIVLESLRWHPVTNIIARRTKEDEVVGEWVIPSGTYVIGNLWGMLHNKELYPDPYAFKPERFLGDEPDSDPTTYAFGFGRRVCPGSHIALQSLWLVISNVLANFEASKFCMPNGDEITPLEEYSSGILSRPLPFKNSIKPRSLTSQALVDETQI